MSERVRIAGTRDLTATLDGPADADALVVACPPHPQMGGSRSDARLRAVCDVLADADVACLRFDYGPWDEGRGEQGDVRDAIAWGRERYASVGLFGFSFGAGLALLAAASLDRPPAATSVLAPLATIVEDGDVVAAVESLAADGHTAQVVYGERDETVDWEPVVAAAQEAGWPCVGVDGGHLFTGQKAHVREMVGDYLRQALYEGRERASEGS